jgi:N-acetylmuramoyl-L-alanine amidase
MGNDNGKAVAVILRSVHRAIVSSCWAVSLSLCVALPAGAEGYLVVSGGKVRPPVDGYKAGPVLYLDAKEVGAMLGGSVYWYSVSGRVDLALHGRTLRFIADSKEVQAGSQTLSMPLPVKVRASRAFIPFSFLESEAFARWAGSDISLDAQTRTISVERRGTVGPVRVFSYSGRTRVSLSLAPEAPWKASARGGAAVDVISDFGVAESEEAVDVDDEVVGSYALKQEAGLARLTIKLAARGQKWKATELSDPRRVVVDVYEPGAEPRGDEPEKDVKPAKPAPKAEAKDEVLTSPLPAEEPAAEPQYPVHAPPPGRRRRLVVVDAGHGGKDPGATGARGSYEKELNLAAALELARVLRERGDLDVVLTRESDVFVPLSERSDLANEKEADLFISLHCNANRRKSENGFEIYSVSETATDPEAAALAAAENASLEFEGKSVQDETAKMILLAMTKTEMINESAAFAAIATKALHKRVELPDRGAKQAGFYVLRGTHAPAILVEMGFVTNGSDEAALGSKAFRRKLAEGVAAGVADYAKRKGWLR